MKVGQLLCNYCACQSPPDLDLEDQYLFQGESGWFEWDDKQNECDKNKWMSYHLPFPHHWVADNIILYLLAIIFGPTTWLLEAVWSRVACISKGSWISDGKGMQKQELGKKKKNHQLR